MAPAASPLPVHKNIHVTYRIHCIVHKNKHKMALLFTLLNKMALVLILCPFVYYNYLYLLYIFLFYGAFLACILHFYRVSVSGNYA